MNSQKSILKKKKFPVGIFLMLLIIESLIAAGTTAFYFRHNVKKKIELIEDYTKNYSLTLIDAFADVAELSYKAKNFKVLKTLFRQEIRENTVDEAFFALNNGKLIVHSISEIEKELKGNIATDEFAYNTDLILRPARRKLHVVQFTSYNVMGKTAPFKRRLREIIKKYVYDEINLPGWLVSKAVYYKKKPVGTVNFIIYKERIFNLIKTQIKEALKFYKIAQAIAFIVSFIVTIVVLIRYRSIQQKTYDLANNLTNEKQDIQDIIEIDPEKKPEIEKTADKEKEEFITIDLVQELNGDQFQIKMLDKDDLEEITEYTIDGKDELSAHSKIPEMIIPSAYNESKTPITGQMIKDAIPVNKKR